jgi:hypothetical protein
MTPRSRPAQVRRRERSEHEVELRGARVFIEAEGELELAAAHAHHVVLLEVGVDVAPGVVVAQLGLDLEFDGVLDLARDADALLPEIDGGGLHRIVRRRFGVVHVGGEPRAEVEMRSLAEMNRRMIVEPEKRVLRLRFLRGLVFFFLLGGVFRAGLLSRLAGGAGGRCRSCENNQERGSRRD